MLWPANDGEASADVPLAGLFYRLRAWLGLDNTEPEQLPGLQIIHLIDRIRRNAAWPTRPVESITRALSISTGIGSIKMQRCVREVH